MFIASVERSVTTAYAKLHVAGRKSSGKALNTTNIFYCACHARRLVFCRHTRQPAEALMLHIPMEINRVMWGCDIKHLWRSVGLHQTRPHKVRSRPPLLCFFGSHGESGKLFVDVKSGSETLNRRLPRMPNKANAHAVASRHFWRGHFKSHSSLLTSNLSVYEPRGCFPFRELIAHCQG